MRSEMLRDGPPAGAMRCLYVAPLRVAVLLFALLGCERNVSTDRPMDGAIIDDGVPVWAIADTPDLMVSAVNSGSDSTYFFHLTGALFLTPGEIVAAVGGEHRLIFLDERGDPLATAGGQGQGPGEFIYLTELFPAADDVAVWDLGTRRVTTFSQDGAVLGTLSLPVPANHRVIGIIDADLTVTSPSTMIVRTAGEKRRYELWDRSGKRAREIMGPQEPQSPVVDLLAVSDGRTSIVRTDFDEGCLPDLMEVVVEGKLFVADASHGALWAIDQEGNAEVVFETTDRPSVSEAMLEGVRERIGDLEQPSTGVPTPGGVPASPRPRRITEESLDSLMARIGGVGEPVPAVWSDVFADRTGRLWLRRAACYSNQPRTMWQIVEPSGRLVANVAIPTGVKLWHADEGRVLAQVSDSVGVEYLAVFSLEK